MNIKMILIFFFLSGTLVYSAEISKEKSVFSPFQIAKANKKLNFGMFENDFTMVKEALGEGANVNKKDIFGFTL